jgi:hypothetical protein
MQSFGLKLCLMLASFFLHSSFIATHSPELPQVQLVILLSIDPPIAPHPNLPRLTIQLWQGFLPNPPPCSASARQRQGRMVWEADWTHAATPLYILLSDIFRGQVPAAYGNNDRVQLDTVSWRQAIIDVYF